MMSGNPGSAWNLINTLQILAFIPMTNINITKKLVEFFAAILNYNIIPNLFQFFIEE